MRFIYSLLITCLTPFLLLRLWYKSLSLPGYKDRILERFALNSPPNVPIDIWLHAVSLGEVIAATPLINACLNQGWSILITTMTPTGSQHVQQKWGNRVFHQYVPYDLPGVVKRFLNKTKPKLGLIMETEIWPNLIHYANRAKVPLLLVNARLSERSLVGYMRARPFFKPILNKLTTIFAQSEDDAKRFIRLGADESRVEVLGNIKFDMQLQGIDHELFQSLKKRFGDTRPTVIIASTHEDEEQKLLPYLKTLQKAIPNVVVLIAPRHPERFQTVYQLFKHHEFNVGLRSNPDSLNADNQVIVLDSMGELMGFYAIANYAFVGGSLVPIGGHNVLEPIAVNVPVVSGPHVHNFKTICRDLETANALKIVNNAEEVIDAIIALHLNPELTKRQVENASHVLTINKGALERTLANVKNFLN